MSKWIVDIHGDIEGDYEIISEYKESDLAKIETQLEASRNRCKALEERLSKQTMECYAEIDQQAVEIALLKSIIEEKGGFHKFHEHIREDSQE